MNLKILNQQKTAKSTHKWLPTNKQQNKSEKILLYFGSPKNSSKTIIKLLEMQDQDKTID